MNLTQRHYALIAGLSLIIMAVTAGYSVGYVQSTLFLPEDPDSTLNLLNENSNLLFSGIIGWIIILVTDILVAWALYKYFEQVNQRISLTTGVIRLIYSAILAIAILQMIELWNSMNLGTLDSSEVTNLYNNFQSYWSHGLIIFGLHLVGVGYLSLKSKWVPVWIGWLLYIAGIGYFVLNGLKAIAPNYSESISLAEMILSVPMAISEIGFAIWLLIKGGKE